MSLNMRAGRNLNFAKLEFERARETKDWTRFEEMTKAHHAMESKIAAIEDKLMEAEEEKLMEATAQVESMESSATTSSSNSGDKDEGNVIDLD